MLPDPALFEPERVNKGFGDAYFVLRQHRTALSADDNVFGIAESRVVEQALGHTKHLLQRASQPGPYEPRVLRLKALTANLQ